MCGLPVGAEVSQVQRYFMRFAGGASAAVHLRCTAQPCWLIGLSQLSVSMKG